MTSGRPCSAGLRRATPARRWPSAAGSCWPAPGGQQHRGRPTAGQPGPRSPSGGRGSWPDGWRAWPTSPGRAPRANSPTSTSSGSLSPTLETRPTDATHWSTRSLARALGMTQSAISRIWRAFGLKPHLAEDVQAVHRPAVHREGPRHRRPVPRTHPRRPSCCAWTRRPRSKRWTAPSRSCRCCPGPWPSERTHDYAATGPPTCTPPWTWPPARSSPT